MSEIKDSPPKAPASSGRKGRCASCGGWLDREQVRPRADVAYVRRRVVLRCVRCKRSEVVNRSPTVLVTGALIVAATCLGWLPKAGWAVQSGAEAFPRVDWLSGSVRALGLGGAYQIGAPGSDAIFHYPSAVAGAGGFAAQLQLWGSGGSAAFLSAATPWFGGAVALGLSNLSFGADSSRASVAQEALFASGPVATTRGAAHLGYARGWGPVEVGAAVKLGEERVGSSVARAALLDLGASAELWELTVAAAYQNLGSGEMGSLPGRLRFGAGGYGLELGPLDVGVAAELAKADSWLPGAGIELGYWPVAGRTYVLRAGLRRLTEGGRGHTLGFSYWGDDLALEWAFQPVAEAADAAGTHRFSVGWR